MDILLSKNVGIMYDGEVNDCIVMDILLSKNDQPSDID